MYVESPSFWYRGLCNLLAVKKANLPRPKSGNGSLCHGEESREAEKSCQK
jgi:predicted alpha/beta superfamily hydrolase